MVQIAQHRKKLEKDQFYFDNEQAYNQHLAKKVNNDYNKSPFNRAKEVWVFMYKKKLIQNTMED